MYKEYNINADDVDDEFLAINKHIIPLNTINNIMVNNRIEVVTKVDYLYKNWVEDNVEAFYASNKHMIPINTSNDRMEVVLAGDTSDKNWVKDDDDYIGNINNDSKIRMTTSVSIINDNNKRSVIRISLINTLKLEKIHLLQVCCFLHQIIMRI